MVGQNINLSTKWFSVEQITENCWSNQIKTVFYDCSLTKMWKFYFIFLFLLYLGMARREITTSWWWTFSDLPLKISSTFAPDVSPWRQSWCLQTKYAHFYHDTHCYISPVVRDVFLVLRPVFKSGKWPAFRNHQFIIGKIQMAILARTSNVRWR